jgi:hypothetical protein
MFRKVLLAFLLVFFWLNIQAGWVISEKTRNPGGAQDSFSTIYFQKNIIKIVQGSFASIFNLEKGEITFLNLEEKFYWKGNFEVYKNEIRKITLDRINEEMNDLPPEVRESYREFYENLLRDLNNPAPVFYNDISPKVEMTAEQKTILNYQSRKYNIYWESFLVEEVWISNRIKISNEIDLDKFRLFMNEMSLGTVEPDHRTSQEYLHLLKSGYPIFSKEFTEAGAIITEVLHVEMKQISEVEFAVPANFGKGALCNFEIF